MSYVPPQATAIEEYLERASGFLVHLGGVSRLTYQAFRAIFSRPFEFRSTIYQMEALGVRSLGIASVVALFTGLVMATQLSLIHI